MKLTREAIDAVITKAKTAKKNNQKTIEIDPDELIKLCFAINSERRNNVMLNKKYSVLTTKYKNLEKELSQYTYHTPDTTIKPKITHLV